MGYRIETIDPARAVVIVVDMQNDFVRQGAPLEVPDARATIAANRRLADGFRSRGLPVIYTRFISLESDNHLWRWSPQCWPEIRCCWAGHMRRYGDSAGELDCSAIIDELGPAPGDIILDKHGYGAFSGTDLDRRLRNAGVRSLLVTGTVTQICVEETARETFHHGYNTVIASDAVSSFAADLHSATLKNFAMKFGWVTDSETALSWL